MCLSKIELCDLAARITNTFPDFPEGSAERGSTRSPTSAISASFWRGVIARPEGRKSPCRLTPAGVTCDQNSGS